MEMKWCQMFNFDNLMDNWQGIYLQKVKFVPVKKLAEFNFKLLHNIVPCGIKIAKWDKTVSALCDYCKMPENTEHMLYKCCRIKLLW